ncbi:MAG: hypothetical protein WED33_11455 [Bacteroidia bacterium]
MKTISMLTKGIILMLLTAFTGLTALAQAPEGVNYQAVIRNAAGELVTSGTVKMRFTVKSGSASGTTVYQESKDLTPNNFGLVTHTIGTGTVSSGTFANIDWDGASQYLKVEADPNGGTSYADLGTNKFQSVPYALHAKTADALTGGSPLNWSLSGNNMYNDNTGNVGIGTTNPQAKLEVNGAVKVQVTTANPAPKTVYGNSMPIAYGFINDNGTVISDYGVASATRLSTGLYRITLDNAFSGTPIVSYANYDYNTIRVGSWYAQSSTVVEIKWFNLSGTATNSAFSFTIHGTPQ